MEPRSGAGFNSLKAGTILGWVSWATAAVILLLSIVQPSIPPFLFWLPNPALLLIAGVFSGVVGAFLCWLALADQRRMARNGIIRGGGGAVLNALIMSLVTITSVVQAPA